MGRPTGDRHLSVHRPRTTIAAWVLGAALFIAWIAIFVADRTWNGPKTDPSLGGHMGSTAAAFPYELNGIMLVAIPLAGGGIWLGRRFLPTLFVAAGVLAGFCTWLFFALDVPQCTLLNLEGGNDGLWASVSLGVLVIISASCGWHLGLRARFRELLGCCLFLIAIVLVIAETQGTHCLPNSQAVIRGGFAIIFTLMLGVVVVTVSSAAFLVRKRVRPASKPLVPTAP